MIEQTNISAIADEQLKTNGLQQEEDKRPGQSYWSLVKHQYRKNKFAVIAMYIVLVMAFIAIFADFLANDKPIIASYNGTTYFPVIKDYMVDIGLSKWPSDLVLADWHDLKLDWAVWTPIRYESRDQDLANTYVAPFTGNHYLGTDAIGRDVLAGLVHGARISLTIGFVAAGIAIIIGVLLGAIAGYYGGWVDIALSRLIEIFLNFPTFFLIITIVAFMRSNVFMVMAVIGITGWTGIARLTRGEVLRVRNMEFTTAANAMGFSNWRIILRHVLPNSLAPVLVSAAFFVAGAILTESTLSFLGFGVPATIVTWGSVLNEARGATYAWWLAIFPGFSIFLTVLSYNLIGEGLRDALDPRLRD